MPKSTPPSAPASARDRARGAEARQVPASLQRPMRADARRNYERLVTTAAAAFAERGAEASLDDIARSAGVGSGTLYRHFPTRQALLEAVYREQVDLLCARADELLESASPAEALETWLRAVADYAATKRGLAAMMSNLDSGVLSYCRDEMRTAGSALLDRAQEAGAVRADVDLSDLLKLLSMIATSNDHSPEGRRRAERLLAVVMDGLRQRSPTAAS
jgi:AcrR family transcriptional regulator